MKLKEKSKNEITERKKRLEEHRKAIENDVKEVTTRKKATSRDGITKKKTIRKKTIDKKALREKQKIIDEKAMGSARNIGPDIEENPREEDSKVIITKEERAERFKRLHAMVKDMMNKMGE